MSDETGATLPTDTGASGSDIANAGVAAGSFSVNPGPDIQPDTTALDSARESFKSLVPESFHTEDWFMNTMKSDKHPMENMIKQYKDTFAMVGKNLKVPTESSTPDEIKSFNKAIGVPENIESYTMPTVEWDEADKQIGAKIESSRDARYVDGMKQVALEAGITNAQWQKVVKGNDKLALKLFKEDSVKADTTKQQNRTEFAEDAKTLYGDRWDSVMQSSWQIIEQSVPPELIARIPTLDNNSRMIIAATINEIKNKYISADNFSTKQGQANTAIKTAQDLKAEGEELMMSKEYSDFNHPRHAEVKARVRSIFNDPRILALGK